MRNHMQQSNQINYREQQNPHFTTEMQSSQQQHLTNVLQNQLSGPAPLNEINGSPLIPARQQQLPINSYSQDVVLAAKPTQLKPTFLEQNEKQQTTLADRVAVNQKPQVQSNSTPSQNSGSTAQIPAQQADTALLSLVVKSEVLELIQDLNSQFDALSPDQVRHRLRTLTQAETEARFRREQYLSAVVRQRVIQESQKFKEQFEEHMKRTFEIETVRFEKLLKDRAQSVIKNIKIQQLDRLINIGSNLRQMQKTHAEQKIQNKQNRPESGNPQRSPPDDRSAPESTSNQPEDHRTVDDLENQLETLVNHLESLMKEISADDRKDASAFDQDKIGANENQINQQPKTGGEFASVDDLNQNRLTSPFTQAQLPKSTTNNEALGANQSNPSGTISQNGGPEIPAAGGNPFGAAVSYGVTSGEVGLVPVTSGSNQILSSNTISGEGGQLFLANQTLNQKQIANLQRSDNSILNQQPQTNEMGKPRFVYDLPTDFPFNQVCIQKSLSNDIGGSSGANQNQVNRSSASGSNVGNPHQNPIPGGKSQERIGNRDVTPEEVLRSFTNQTSCLLDALAQDSQGKLLDRGNSLASGETLQSIHQSLTYYKEALQSKDWSNLSPSNAYQNYMFRKNLVGEIQKLAKEISRIPTEEAKILADLSKSHLSNHESFKRFQNGGGISSSNFIVGQSIKSSIPGNILHPLNPSNQGMATASQIAQGLGFIGNNESSVLMDLNRASIVAAQREAEEAAIKSQTRRIVDDSVTRLERLEPLVQDFTNAPIDGNLMEPQYRLIKYQQQRSSLMEGSNSNMFDSTKIMHDLTHKPSQDRSSSAMRDSQVVYGDQRTSDKKRVNNSVNKRNSKNEIETKQSLVEEDMGGIQVGSATADNNEMIMYTTTDQNDEHQQQQHKQSRSNQMNDFTMGPLPNGGIMQGQDPRGYASVIISQTPQDHPNQCETPDLTLNGGAPAAQDHYMRDKKGIEAAAAEAARGSMPMSGQQFSPKQRGSIHMKKNKNKPGAGFFSNDNVPVLSEIELDRIQMEQTAPQQIASFAPKDSSGWLFEDAEEFSKNQNFFSQTNQGRSDNLRGGTRSQLQQRGHNGEVATKRHRQNAHSIGNGYQGSANNGTISQALQNYKQRKGSRMYENHYTAHEDLGAKSSHALDNKGRAIPTQNDGNLGLGFGQDESGNLLEDELNRTTTYKSSKSALDGHHGFSYRKTSHLNKTMQSGKIMGTLPSFRAEKGGKNRPEDLNLNVMDRSHVTASPAPSGGTTGAPKIIKMNLKKNQIKLSNGVALPAKRNSVHNQIVGISNVAGIQSKSVSREGRLKVKLIQKSKANAVNSSGLGGHENGSPRQSRNVANNISGTAGPLGKNRGSGQVIKSMRQPVQNSLRGETGRFQDNLDFSPDDTDIRGASPMLSYDGNRSALDNPKIVKNIGRNNKQNPFKTSTSRQVATPDLANEKSHVTNNFFGEQKQEMIADLERQRAGTSAEVRQNVGTQRAQQMGSKGLMEYHNKNLVDPQQADQLRQGQNVSTLSAGPYPLKIKRPIKLQKDKIKTRRKTAAEQQIPQEQADAEAFNEIARNLRTSAQNVTSAEQTQAVQYSDKFGSNRRSVDESHQYLSSEPQTMHTSPATAIGDRKYVAESYNTTQTLQSVIPSQSQKSRQGTAGFVRTHKSRKSRQSGDLSRGGFGTERVSFHQSNGQSSKQGMELPIEEESDFIMPDNYSRPAGQNSTSATVRVQSHSQPPLEKQSVKQMGKLQQSQAKSPQMIPPATNAGPLVTNIPTSSSNQNSGKTESRANSQNARRDPQTGHLILNVKRPIVKMAGINFVTASSNNDQQNMEILGNTSGNINQNELPKKKASLAQALETSPYLTQTRINNNQANAGMSTGNQGNKRIIQLKRPSTNMTMQNSANQQSLISKNSMFAQRAASRIEQVDRQNELNLQTQQNLSNPNIAQQQQQAQIQPGQPLNQRQATQMRFGKRPSGGQTNQSQTQNIQPQSGIKTFLRPQSDLSDAASNYQ